MLFRSVAESEGDAEEVVRGRLESSVLAAARAASPLLRERRPELYTLVGEPV